MKIKIYYCIALFVLSIATNKIFAQDLHFSQTTMIPLVINPALTGDEGDQRVVLNYKEQWRGLSASGAAFTTAFFSVDGSFYKKRWEKGYLGIGLTGYKDVAGDLKLGTTQLNLSFAGIVRIGRKQTVSGGFQSGYLQRSISTADMQWESQYDSGLGGYNGGILSNDIAALPPTKSMNVSAGVAWHYSRKTSSIGANNQLKANAGLSLQNINAPNQNFSTIIFDRDRLYRRFIVHGTLQAGIPNTDFEVIPNVAFYKQGPSTELNVGALLRYAVKNRSRYTNVYKGTSLSVGGNYRLGDAIIPMIMLEHSNYSVKRPDQ